MWLIYLDRISTYPDSGLREAEVVREVFPDGHVRVAVALEQGLQLLQLLAGEVGPLTAPVLPQLFPVFVQEVTAAAAPAVLSVAVGVVGIGGGGEVVSQVLTVGVGSLGGLPASSRVVHIVRV